MRLLIGAIFLSVACSFATTNTDDLPDAVAILSVEYHEAYRLLPSDHESLERIEAEFANFNLEEWQALEWDAEGYEVVPPSLNVGSVLPMLQSAAGRPEDRQWIANHIHVLDPDAASRFLEDDDVFGLTDILKELVEQQGFYREVEEISLRFDGMKAGEPQEVTNLVVEQHLAVLDYLAALGKLNDKERAVLENEVGVCVLLMELVVGEAPFTAVEDGRCNISLALNLASPPTS